MIIAITIRILIMIITIFFQNCSYFIKQKSLEWLEILKTLMMTWAVEEHCLEINVILIQ